VCVCVCVQFRRRRTLTRPLWPPGPRTTDRSRRSRLWGYALLTLVIPYRTNISLSTNKQSHAIPGLMRTISPGRMRSTSTCSTRTEPSGLVYRTCTNGHSGRHGTVLFHLLDRRTPHVTLMYTKVLCHGARKKKKAINLCRPWKQVYKALDRSPT
jgi:hypothetical protein